MISFSICARPSPEVRPGERDPVAPGRVEVEQSLRHLVRRSHHRYRPEAGDHPLDDLAHVDAVPVGTLRIGHVEPHDIAGTFDVGQLAMDALVLASSLALAVAADDVRATEHRQLAPMVLAGVALDRADLLGCGLEVGQPGVDEVAVARGELTTGAARARVHDHRVGALQRFGVRATPREVEVAAMEVALALDGPQLLEQRRPLVATA